MMVMIAARRATRSIELHLVPPLTPSGKTGLYENPAPPKTTHTHKKKVGFKSRLLLLQQHRGNKPILKSQEKKMQGVCLG